MLVNGEVKRAGAPGGLTGRYKSAGQPTRSRVYCSLLCFDFTNLTSVSQGSIVNN